MAQRKRLNMEIDIDINCDVIDTRDHQPIDAGMCYPAQFSPKFARSSMYMPIIYFFSILINAFMVYVTNVFLKKNYGLL
jgi:hypothetical protein